jgi:hypothetical protein
MLTAARNDMLTRVGPGTPMGNLLRRADRWRKRACEEADKTGALLRRGFDTLQGSLRSLRADREALPTSRRRFVQRYRRGTRYPLLLSWLEIRRARAVHRAALRRHRQ